MSYGFDSATWAVRPRRTGRKSGQLKWCLRCKVWGRKSRAGTCMGCNVRWKVAAHSCSLFPCRLHRMPWFGLGTCACSSFGLVDTVLHIYIYISIQTVSYCVKIHKHHHFHQQQHICTQSSASIGFMDLIEEFENKEQTAPERLENLRTRSQPLEKD